MANTECGKSFHTELLTYCLYENAYSGEKPFKCDECEKSFLGLLTVFGKHERTLEQNHKCTECGKILQLELPSYYCLIREPHRETP